MSEGDYFTTILHLYHHPTINSIEVSQKQLDNDKVCEVFLPTPSDAPKNFTMTMPNYRFSHNNKKMVGVSRQRQDEIIAEKEKEFAQALHLIQGDKTLVNSTDMVEDGVELEREIAAYINNKLSKTKQNNSEENVESDVLYSISNEELIDLVTSKYKDSIRRSFSFNKKSNIGSKNYQPVVYTEYKTEGTIYHVIVLNNEVLKVKDKTNNKERETNTILTPKIHGVFSFIEITDNNNKRSVHAITNKNMSLPSVMTSVNKSKIIENYILDDITNRGKDIIENSLFEINETPMREVFLQEVLGEMNAMVDAINTVFESGTQSRYLKENLNNLVDGYHFYKTIAKNGKLTGRAFEFTKLFNLKINDIVYNAGEELLKVFGLYQNENGEGIVKQDSNGKMYIDIRAIQEGTASKFISVNKDGMLSLNIKDLSDINNIIDKWIKLYTYEIVNEYSRFSDIASQHNYTYENTIEAIFGNTIGLYNTTELFYGEDKFYGNSRIFFKRAKEAQAGGHGFALYDITAADNSQIREYTQLTVGNTKIDLSKEIDRTLTYELTDQNGKKVLYHLGTDGVQYKDGFTAVTIKNTEMAIKTMEKVYDEMMAIYEKEGLDKTVADKLAISLSRRYGFNGGKLTKVNDAQSYITFEEFIVRRIADGTIDEYRDIITQILEVRNGYKTIDQIDLDGINARIQVQKNFYFDMNVYRNSETGTSIRCGRQIKNAEFVIIPELCKGSDLEVLYNIMKQYGINQINTVETSKATKRNILTFWDNEGKAHPEKFITDLNANKASIESFYYKYLYKQQDVPQHMQDTENKAGIQLTKKIMDNMSGETKPYVDQFIKNYVDQFIKNYVANITSSFNELMFACGWKVAENGTITNFDGSKVTFEYFNEKAKREATRLGLDTNFVEYFELDETTHESKLPNWMNNVSAKIESISNGIFNSMITRQKLPGWHGAQVTSVGFANYIKDEDGETKKLQYYPPIHTDDGSVKREAYVEIMLPRWSSLLKDIDIEQIKKGGVDVMLIYRMPTEGKQSVAIAKVVGILPDTYGSSVVVPHGWVTQTGSDFDVDSIYAITKEMRRTLEGVEEIKPLDMSIEANAKKAYMRYVANMTDIKIKKGFYLENEEEADKLKSLQNQLDAYTKEYEESKEPIRDAIKLLNDRIDEAFKKDEKGRNTSLGGMLGTIMEKLDANEELHNVAKDGKSYRNVNFYIELEKEFIALEEKVHAKDKKKVKNLKNRTNVVNELLARREELIANKKEDLESLKALREESFENVQQIAAENGILSFEEFNALPDVMKQSKEVRNNQILEAMIKIMSHEKSREEIYTGSNFDDIGVAINRVNELTGRNAAFESPYNPFTQIKYFNDAMSGAVLKAFSVTRDTANSIFNYTKAELSTPITVRYYSDMSIEGHKEEDAYNLQAINTSYGGVINEQDGYIEVVHNKLAHSTNNRNVVQKLITVYGSETTAHILDAIKEGPITNENTFTFGTFKTLIDLGVDFNTAIGWLALPGIDLICKAYYNTNSIYTEASGNPIHNAVRELARRGNIIINNRKINEYTSFKDIYNYIVNEKSTIKLETKNGESVVSNISEIAKSLGYDLTSNGIFALDTKLIKRRLSTGKDSLNELESFVFDFVTIMQFAKINDVTKRMENLIRLSNPDKFGAKQSVRETFETMYKIQNYRSGEHFIEEEVDQSVFNTFANYELDDVSNNGSVITINGKNYIDAIYPLNERGEIDIENSAYPHLAAFLKYSTSASVNINAMLFELEKLLIDYEFNDTSQTGLIGRKFTEKEYKAFTQYLVSHIYKNTNLSRPLIYDEEIEDINYAKSHTEEDIDTEIARIKGNETLLPYTINSFTVADINNVTKEEIKKFLLLTPAQKVLAMQRLFSNDRGIFAKFDLDFYGNPTNIDKGIYSHTIRIDTQNESIEDLYKMFNQMATSKHPLIKLTAIDLIKYAFISEGFRFKKNSVTKIITNDALFDNKLMSISGIEDYINLMDDIKDSFYDFTSYASSDLTDIYDKFIRSNETMVPLNSVFMRMGSGQQRGNISKLNAKYKKGYNSYLITEKEHIDAFMESYSKGDRIADLYSLPRFVRLRHRINTYKKIDMGDGAVEFEVSGNTVVNQLFKVYPLDNGSIFLLGVPKLEVNEVENVSQNVDNNVMEYGQRRESYLKDFAVEPYINFVFESNEENKKTWNDIKKNAVVKRTYNKKISDNTIHEDYINDCLNSDNHVLNANANTIISYLEDFLNSEMEDKNSVLFFGVNDMIRTIMSKNVDKLPINITLNGINYKMFITNGKFNKYWYGALKKNEKSIATLPVKYKYAYNHANKAAFDTTASRLYEIRLITEEEYNKLESEKTKVAEENPTHFSTLSGVDFIENESVRDNPFQRLTQDPISDRVEFISNIIYSITRETSVNQNDPFVQKIKEFVAFNHIETGHYHSIQSNMEQLMPLVKEYYTNRAKYFTERFGNFFDSATNPIAIDSDAMIETLRENPELFNQVIRFLLEARVFGKAARQYAAGIDTGNREFNGYIQDIINSISSVITDTRLNKAYRRMFNDYIAERFSDNPNIKMQILDLSTSFDDATFIDSWIADIGELSNKQVQVVFNRINNVLNAVQRLTIPQQQAKFKEEFEKYDNNINWDLIIDTSTGKFVREYTDRYIEDKQKHIELERRARENLEIAKVNYKDAIETGVELERYTKEYERALVEHQKAHLKKSKWFAANVEQELVQEYYDEYNNVLETMLNSGFNEEFGAYLRLKEELKNLTTGNGHYTEEEVAKIEDIKAQINKIISPYYEIEYDENDPFAPFRPVTPEQQAIIDRNRQQKEAFESYINGKRDVNNKYFKYEPSQEWVRTRDEFIKIIEEFDKDNPDMTLAQKLNNVAYKDAYNWLKANTFKTLNEEGLKKLNKYRRDLGIGRTQHSNKIHEIIRNAKAYDEYGEVDPTKLTEEDIQKIRDIYNNYYERLAAREEEGILIKEIPESPVMTNEYNRLYDEFRKGTSDERTALIQQIKDILIKGVDSKTGQIKTELLWNNTTEEERKQLGRLYMSLRLLSPTVKNTRGVIKKINNVVEHLTNDVAFSREYSYARANFADNSVDMRLWKDIFIEKDEDGNYILDGLNYKGNNFIYGYTSVKKDADGKYPSKYVDAVKTEALDFMKHNTRQVLTEKYYIARNEALAQGAEAFEQWYQLNHFYNAIRHRWEPLRIWTQVEVVPGKDLYETSLSAEQIENYLTTDEATYGYNPTFENTTRSAKDEYINRPNGEEYNRYNDNYKNSGAYVNPAIRVLDSNHRNMRNLLMRVTKEYAFTNRAKRFTELGYVPREYKAGMDLPYVAKQALGLIGIDWIPSKSDWNDIGFSEDVLPTQGMYEFIKVKGYKQRKGYPERPAINTREAIDAYNKQIEAVKKENEEIDKHNRELEQNYLNKDYKQVFLNLISSGEEYKAKQDIKNLIYFLVEDLKSTDSTYSNKAYHKNNLTDRLIRKNRDVVNKESNYSKIEQNNTIEVVINTARRILYNQFKKPHKLNTLATALQSFTSSKYMYFNLPGGITNVLIGWTNIMGEVLGQDYLESQDIRSALGEYTKGTLDYLGSAVMETTPSTKASALINLMRVVDYDAMLMRQPNESLDKWISRTRSLAFGFQTSGEHFMQNVVMLAMMKSHRLYVSTDRYGKKTIKIGSFKNYAWDIEQQAMKATLNEIAKETRESAESLQELYKSYINANYTSIEELDKLDQFKTNINKEFLRNAFGDNYKEYAQKYIDIYNEMMKNAKENFEANNENFYDQFEYDGTNLTIKQGSILLNNDGSFIKEYQDEIFGKFVTKVISVNKKIHGVYDKMGAARLESTLLGSLAMQYHKHIYPGIMKRWRGVFNRAYYNEFRQSVEKGSYTSLIEFLGTEFKGIGKRIKMDVNEQQTTYALAITKEVINSLINTISYANLNWNMLQQWERDNIRRTIGDLSGIMAAFGIAVMIYAFGDDDEIKDSNLASAALYIADSFYAQSRMYTPRGLYVEGKTLWSSPIAANNGVIDILKIAEIYSNILTDEEFNPYYTTGQYKGRHKAAVAFYRNIPAYRVFNRMQNFKTYNKYYRLGDVGVTKRAKKVANTISPDKK
jgi:hypothetical protein